MHVPPLSRTVAVAWLATRVASQVRAAVGVVGSIVAGLPPSAKKLQGDAAVHRAGLAVIAEAEPDAAETAQQPGSESMLPADEAAVQSGQGAGHAAGSLQHGPSRKRSSHSLPLEPVPEHAEKVKRPKHASSATEGDTVSLRGSPPKVVALEKGGGKAKTARAAAASHEDVAAVKPTQGDFSMTFCDVFGARRLKKMSHGAVGCVPDPGQRGRSLG